MTPSRIWWAIFVCNLCPCLGVKVVIQKCCPEKEVLDQWHKCIPNTRSQEIFTKEIQNITGQNKQDCIIDIKNLLIPRPDEFKVLRLLRNATVLVMGRNDSIPYHCMDLTLTTSGELDGLHAIVTTDTDNIGNITKCCPGEKILDENHAECVDIPARIQRSRKISSLPPRAVVSPLTELPTSSYKNTRSTFPQICNGDSTLYPDVKYFLTDGKMAVREEDEDLVVKYKCWDRL